MTRPDARRLLQMIGDLDRLLVEVLKPALQRNEIRREHWQVLRLLEDGQGHSMGEISQTLGLPGAKATRVVDFLAANMLVYRGSDPLDRRRVMVHLTEAGKETLRRVEDAMHDHTAPLLDKTGTADRRELGALLEKLLKVAAVED